MHGRGVPRAVYAGQGIASLVGRTVLGVRVEVTSIERLDEGPKAGNRGSHETVVQGSFQE